MPYVKGVNELNNLLIDEYPLIIIPSLAKKIGLNEAILLQQIHFWIGKKKHYKDGHYWVYNTYDEWLNQFPFWSKSTIRRAINSLEKKELLITGNYNKLQIDNTKWYTINYDTLNQVNRPSVQNEQTTCSKWTGGHVQNEQTITIDYPETNNIDSNSSSAYTFYQNNFGTLSPFVAESIEHWINDLSEELVIESMKLAAKAHKRFNYAEGILKDWLKNNVRTLDDVQARETEHKNKNNKKKGNDGKVARF